MKWLKHDFQLFVRTLIHLVYEYLTNVETVHRRYFKNLHCHY